MARWLSDAKILHASVTNFSFSFLNRRGYAVRGMLANLSEQGGPTKEPAMITDDSGAAVWWIPDPITGFYKPSHHTDQHDPAKLRAMAASHRIRTKLRQIKD